MVTWSGDEPTGIVVFTVLVAVLMTDTVLRNYSGIALGGFSEWYNDH